MTDPTSPVTRSRLSRFGLAAALLLLLLSVGPGYASAQDSGVTVINVPPEFSAVTIGIEDGLHRIDVVVSDYNSWSDIYRVDVEVLDDERSQVAHVHFQQYPSNTSTSERQLAFIQNVGDILILDQSNATFNPDPGTIAERSEMHVVFVLTPVPGRWLRVTASDLSGLEATAQVEYLTGIIGAGGGDVVPQLVIVVTAAIGTLFVVATRIRREEYGV